ncbi:MAG: hypothetical protein F2534_03495 [Actinobacteria bacterium]|nr:hypothetical protein [Actinomycetota bacterium]
MITMIDKAEGFESSAKSERRVYLVRGSTDQAVVRAHVLANTPPMLGALRRGVPTFNTIRPGVWQVSLEWGPISGDTQRIQPETTDFFTSGSVRAVDVTLTQAIQHIGSFGNSGSVSTPYSGAINVDDQGVAQGVSIPTGMQQFDERGYKPAAAVDGAWIRLIGRNAFKVNSDVFRGFQPGELLYMGSSWSFRAGQNDYEVISTFAIAENQDAFTINADGGTGASISVPGKEGHDLLWVEYRDVPDPSGRIIKVPDVAHIERVFRRTSFAALQLPNPTTPT